MMEKNNRRIPYAAYGIIALVGILIAAAGIVFHQSFFHILPLFVSLFISYLQSRVSRYAPLLGSFNSLLYAAVYGHYHLYASMMYAILVSFPLQLITFLRWQKNRWRGTTVFRCMTVRQRGLTVFLFIAAWAGLLILLRLIGSSFAILDNTISLLGILISFLTMFAYIEYTTLMIPSSLINLLLYISMLREHPEQSTYLIFSVYCFICQCIAYKNAREAYRQQNAVSGDPGKNLSADCVKDEKNKPC